jgi:hypothetical protein
LDSLGTVISTALLDTLEQLPSMSDKARGLIIGRMEDYVKKMEDYAEEMQEEEEARPLIDVMTNSINYFANEELMWRYRQLALCFGVLWGACWSFWVLRLVLRMKLKADFTGI